MRVPRSRAEQNGRHALSPAGLLLAGARCRGGQGDMSEYQGYIIKLNPETGRREIFWEERKQLVDFAREADAEQWINDLMPFNR